MKLTQTRRRMLQVMAGTMAAAAVQPVDALMQTRSSANTKAQGRLPAQAFDPLPLGDVRPAGWLERQLRIQADGLTGHLGETWPDVGPNSGWLGGSGESWERGPYYLDGLLPIAVLLNDDRLMATAKAFIEWTLTHQQSNGMIGPTTNNDWWPRMVMVKVLAQYYEATGDARVLPCLTRYFHHQLAELPARPLRDWGKFRWQDEVYVVQWLYTRTGDPALLELNTLLRQQGFDWVDSFVDFPFKEKVDKQRILENGGENNPRGYQSHGVNNGQAIKTAAVQFRMDGNAGNRAGFYRQVEALDRYHGMPNGMFSCDEHLAGLNPSQGTELCTVVETMFSLEVSLAAFGDAPIADRIEKIAYNALPATLTADMWAHQYDQQPNQVQCSLNSKPWTTNSAESNLFGLEPHFGCCTANYHQGWPKLVVSMWMRTPDDGLAATIYGPCTVKTHVRGTAVAIEERTEYPFRDSISLTVSPERPVHFPLQVRVPQWADAIEVRINGATHKQSAKAGTFLTLEREWKAGDTVDLRLPMLPRVSRWFQNSVAIERGPLLFSYSAGEHWVKLRDRGLTADWQVFPDRAWNYALLVNESNASSLQVSEDTVAETPFVRDAAAVSIHVPARMLVPWRVQDGVAPAPPQSPVTSTEQVQMLTLVPYGSARLRISAFPELLNQL